MTVREQKAKIEKLEQELLTLEASYGSLLYEDLGSDNPSEATYKRSRACADRSNELEILISSEKEKLETLMACPNHTKGKNHV